MKADVAKLPNAVQSAIAKDVKRLEQDFQRVQLEIMAFSKKEKAFYKVEFYIPTEDKKHWTAYDKRIFTESGNVTKENENE